MKKTMLRCVAVLAGVCLACLGCGKEQEKPSAPPKAQPKKTADDGRGQADQCDHAGHKH